MSNPLIVEHVGRDIIIRFNRPQIRSPLSITVVDDLSRIVSDISGAGCVIFTGVGNIFASGADLREIARLDKKDAGEFALRGQKLMRQISDLPKTVAAVNGVCFGGALDLALACKHRIASPDAVFAHPGANLGIITGWGGTQRLPRLVGEANALEMFFTAKQVTATEALRIGLVDEVTEDVLGRALGKHYRGELDD